MTDHRLLILAADRDAARLSAADLGLSAHSHRWAYLAGQRTLRGRTNVRIHRGRGWANNPRAAEVDQALTVVAARGQVRVVEGREDL